MPSGGFFMVDPAPIKKGSTRLRQIKKDLQLQTDRQLGNYVKKYTQEAIIGIYGEQLGRADRWRLTWQSNYGDGSLGLLTVKALDPHVLYYEFGTQEHAEMATGSAQGGPDKLAFFWANVGKNFLGEVILHPTTEGHDRRFYLIAFLRDVGKWGWSSAARNAGLDAPYADVPATPRIFHPDQKDNTWDPSAPVIYGQSLLTKWMHDPRYSGLTPGQIMGTTSRRRSR